MSVYAGQYLRVDLSSGAVTQEPVTAGDVSTWLLGSGLAAYLLSQLPDLPDPTLPTAPILIFNGLLTGSFAPGAARTSWCGRSPLTGIWNESNVGGHWGAELRFAGLDGLVITGRAAVPVYLWVHDGQAQVREAGHLWGRGTFETHERLLKETAPGARVACIGPAGEKQSLMAAIINDDGRAAARCGLGAVMGAKNLKAVAARGKVRPPLADPEAFRRITDEYRRLFRRKSSRWASGISGFLLRILPIMRRLRARMSGGPTQMVIDTYRLYGTAAGTAALVELGDTPVRNWTGIGYRDFPLRRAARLSDEAVIRPKIRGYGCSFCPVACGGIVRLPDGDTDHKPEYETLAAFGPLLLNDDLDVVMRCNRICNRAGLDTISTGVAVAFAVECGERGWLPPELAEELPLDWGNGEAIVELTARIARREPGLGEWLADGVRRAAERLGPEAQEAAIHAGGQELAMHRGLYEPGVALGYQVDPAPGRHTATLSGTVEVPPLMPYFALEGVKPGARYDYATKGRVMAVGMSVLRAYDSLGLCQFALYMGEVPFLAWLNAATGWGMTEREFLEAGREIQRRRHAFNERHGLPREFPLPARERGEPPQEVGPLAGITLDMEAMARAYFADLGMERRPPGLCRSAGC